MAPPLSNFLETFLYATIWILLFGIGIGNCVPPSFWLADRRRHLRFLCFCVFLCVLYENQISIQLLPHNTHFDSFACTLYLLLWCYRLLCGVDGWVVRVSYFFVIWGMGRKVLLLFNFLYEFHIYRYLLGSVKKWVVLDLGVFIFVTGSAILLSPSKIRKSRLN